MAEQPVETFAEETKSEKTEPELMEAIHDQGARLKPFTIMTINMNGDGYVNDRKKLISKIAHKVVASVIFCQELPGYFEKEVVKKCGSDYKSVYTGNEAAVIWRESDFHDDPVRGTDSSIDEIVKKLQRKRSDIDVSEARTRTAMVKLTCGRMNRGAAPFLAVSWHGPSKKSEKSKSKKSLDTKAKQKIFDGLICFVREVCKKEQLSSFIIGGDFNLNTLKDIRLDLEQHGGVIVSDYVLNTRDEKRSQRKGPGRPFIRYKDNFVLTRTGDITVSEVKPLEFKDSEVLDHAPVVGVLELILLPNKKPSKQVIEEYAEGTKQSDVSTKTTNEKNRPDFTPEKSDRLSTTRKGEELDACKKLFPENDEEYAEGTKQSDISTKTTNEKNRPDFTPEKSDRLSTTRKGEELDVCKKLFPENEQPICEVVYTWKFPVNFSQSTINGRTDSNACSVISIAVAHTFLTTNIQPPSGEDLPSDWNNLLRQCIQEGNKLYDSVRPTLPHPYLTAEEAAVFFNKPRPLVNVEDPLPLWLEGEHESFTLEKRPTHPYVTAEAEAANKRSLVKVEDPLPLRLVDEHEQSTLGYRLQKLTEANTRGAALFIYDNKTITFLACPNHSILVIDSHLHSTFGAAIIFAKPFSPVFISCLREITGMNNLTYGNFSHVIRWDDAN